MQTHINNIYNILEMSKLNFNEETRRRIWDAFNSSFIFERNDNKQPPVVSVAINKNDHSKMIIEKNREKAWVPQNRDLNQNRPIPKWMFHAENYIIKTIHENDEKPSDYHIIVAFQPCNGCIRMMNKEQIKEIYFIFDKGFEPEEAKYKKMSLIQFAPVDEQEKEIYSRLATRMEQIINKAHSENISVLINRKKKAGK